MNFNPFSEKPHFLESIKPGPSVDGPAFNDFPFIIPINKPAGITSLDCIRKMRPRIFSVLGRGKGRRKLKIGHFGTLDPFADGVLLIGTGKAMRMMAMVQENLKKNYRAICEFGEQTITGDLDGEVIKTWSGERSSSFKDDLFSNISSKIDDFTGEYLQIPPYFSAVKHEGRPLYEYARKGIFIEKEPVLRHIHSLSIEETEKDLCFEMNCSVSNGTYIRCLWQDLLADYEKVGHLTALTRTSYGHINSKDCLDLEEFCSAKQAEFFFTTPWQILDFPILELSLEQGGAILQGAFLEGFSVEVGRNYWMNIEGVPIALGVGVSQNSSIKVKAQVNLF